MIGKILSIADEKGQELVDYSRNNWRQHGYELAEFNADSVHHINDYNGYRMVALTMGSNNCDKFRECIEIIRLHTDALIILFPCEYLSPETKSCVLLSGADRVIDVSSLAGVFIEYCITLMRRHDEMLDSGITSSTVYVAYKLYLDIDRCLAEVDGRAIPLEKKELDVLRYLMENRGIFLTHDQILERVWGEEYVGGPRHVLWTQIKNIREKIQWKPSLPQYIITKHGFGYTFDPHINLMAG